MLGTPLIQLLPTTILIIALYIFLIKDSKIYEHLQLSNSIKDLK